MQSERREKREIEPDQGQGWRGGAIKSAAKEREKTTRRKWEEGRKERLQDSLRKKEGARMKARESVTRQREARYSGAGGE